MNKGGSGREPHSSSSWGPFTLVPSRMARLAGVGQDWVWSSGYYLSLPSWEPLGPPSFAWLQLTPSLGSPFLLDGLSSGTNSPKVWKNP